MIKMGLIGLCYLIYRSICISHMRLQGIKIYTQGWSCQPDYHSQPPGRLFPLT